MKKSKNESSKIEIINYNEERGLSTIEIIIYLAVIYAPLIILCYFVWPLCVIFVYFALLALEDYINLKQSKKNDE